MSKQEYQVQIIKVTEIEDLILPLKMSELASGYDLHAAIDEEIMIQPGQRQLIPTGIAIAMPSGLEAQIRPRSGLALKHGITVLNSPGTIDADYRGEIKIILINLGEFGFIIRKNERIAQMVFQQVPQVNLLLVDQLHNTKRGSGGFGHTGI